MNQKVLSPFPFEEQGNGQAVAYEKFGAATIDLLSEWFCCAPMSSALGLSARDLAPPVARFILECTTNGRSTRGNFL
jgi:hypothetical protein